MKLLIILLLPLVLLANLKSDDNLSKQYQWLLKVEEALQSENVCNDLPILINAKEADKEVNLVLEEIIRTRCR